MGTPLRIGRSGACVETDAGEGFLKAMGNPESPHVLACELVGTLLAEWLGLPTLEARLFGSGRTTKSNLRAAVWRRPVRRHYEGGNRHGLGW
jgi:hypothetical protein